VQRFVQHVIQVDHAHEVAGFPVENKIAVVRSRLEAFRYLANALRVAGLGLIHTRCSGRLRRTAARKASQSPGDGGRMSTRLLEIRFNDSLTINHFRRRGDADAMDEVGGHD